ncbi:MULTISPECIES: CAP domain-containing protein [Lactobacillus]|uniref:CAP domain-containing protein n=1 Tax=Lactobacillus xujianguonis TaxID=2495899 RepID=A0A437SVY9_9LACO|nr:MULTISPECIES: CAP domain-containing protein [Lactobacillus]RVU71052.1 CAP domain-containing protein [Lactobacillus xujianguonis]RVU76792.1 CAP domain-containing protein [Lactobacillus xujianguonis]
MFLRRLSIMLVAELSLAAPFSLINQNAKAATFSPGEVSQVHHFQKEYASLSKKRYNINNLYDEAPHLSAPFKAGKLKKNYISSQLAYINYYRSLFGLPAVTANATTNTTAQKTAAVMAAINANPFINQHGLPSETKPNYINHSLWKLAQDTSETSNLNFNVNDQTAGDVITDLLTDHYNLTGSDTGHRAWLLSTRLTTTGIGAAYGSNGYRYSVQKVLNVDDLFKPASKAAVVYPSNGVFPVELAKGKKVAWSIYLSNRAFTKKPKITITDKDTKITHTATNIKNYSNNGYGNFKTVITYSPGKTKIIAGHEYVVKVNKLYKYSFKLFKQTTNLRQASQHLTSKAKTYQNALAQKNTTTKSPFLIQNAKLWATRDLKSKLSQPFNYFDSLKKGQWDHNFFIRNLLKIK